MHAPTRSGSSRGASALEFALWLPVILAMIAGITDISWMMHSYHNVVRSARDGARVGVSIIEDEDTVAGSEVRARAVAHAQAILEGVRMPCDDRCDVTARIVTDSGAEFLEVQVRYDYEPLLNFLPLATTLESTFIMMLQQQSG